MRTYATSEVARMLDVSPSTIRNYCKDARLQPYLSASATPTGNNARQLTASDVKLLSFVSASTRQRATMPAILEALQSGALDAYEGITLDTAENPPEAPTAALALIPQLTAALDAYRESERELYERLLAAERRALEAEAELTRLRSRSLLQRIANR